MRKIALITPVILVLMVSVLAAGCRPLNIISASGPVTTKGFTLTDFTGVETGNAFELEVTRADAYSISVTANESLFKYIDVSKYGSTLRIRMTAININLGKATLKAKVSMPDLRSLDISGAAQVEARGFNSTNPLDIELSGASQLEMSGAAGSSKMDISGASKADLLGLTLKDADISISGASRAYVTVTGRLDVDVSGASTLEYAGGPTLGNVDVSGASQFKRR